MTIKELMAYVPDATTADALKYCKALSDGMPKFGVTTPLRIAAYLANIAHETLHLHYTEEIASGAAYEGRKDLGNIHPGDGKKYKGRGPLQHTGYDNYVRIEKVTGIKCVANPELIAIPENGVLADGVFWEDRKLNAKADNGDFWGICKAINGINQKTGTPNGWKERCVRYAHIKKVMGIL